MEGKPESKVQTNKKKKEVKDELSEEDKELKEQLEMLITRLTDPIVDLHFPALETLKQLIRTSTSSMTSVPKPLKFLRPHYDRLITIYNEMKEESNKKHLSDIISVLAMTSSEAKRETLKYRFSGSTEAIQLWGHEYVRHLAAEIGQEYAQRTENSEPCEDLIQLTLDIVPFFISHNAEAEACDILMEVEAIEKVIEYVDENNFERVCLYLMSCVHYVPEPEDQKILETVLDIYKKVKQYPDALIIALRLNNPDIVKELFDSCEDESIKKQMSFFLSRQQFAHQTDNEELDKIINSTHLNEQFTKLLIDLNIQEPKTPEEIYKTHLDQTKQALVDSAKQNLASTFVNALVNAGSGKDKLMSSEQSWLFKNKDHGMLSAAASLGMIHMWDVEGGLAEIDKYLYSTDDNVRAGALLAVAIVNAGVRNEVDPALAILQDFLKEDEKSALMKTTAIIGLGIAYSGTCREDVMEMLLPLVNNTYISFEMSCFAALSLGQIFVSSSNGAISEIIIETLMERDPKQLKEPFARYMALGLALLYLGKQESAELVLETLKTIAEPFGKQASVLVEVAAYAGTGNVLKIQEMLHLCSDHIIIEKPSEPEGQQQQQQPGTSSPAATPNSGASTDATSTNAENKNEDKNEEPTAQEGDDEFQSFAVLGIALIAMGEEIGSEMSLRCFGHLMHYGEPIIRRTVPLALSLLRVCNPQEISVLETLSKYSHDNDPLVAQSAIFAMGVVGAGTNNARLAQMLRQLAVYYQKDANNLFMVRIAQGFLYMGKGSLTVNPNHSHKLLWSPVGLSGILTLLISMTIPKQTIHGKHHYMLYQIVNSMFPRCLVTLDEDLKPLQVQVRVGKAVDTVGQAGKPKTITGFQTHTTPVLLGHGERAELATEEYVPLTNVLEGFVIMKKNKDYMEVEKK